MDEKKHCFSNDVEFGLHVETIFSVDTLPEFHSGRWAAMMMANTEKYSGPPEPPPRSTRELRQKHILNIFEYANSPNFKAPPKTSSPIQDF